MKSTRYSLKHDLFIAFVLPHIVTFKIILLLDASVRMPILVIEILTI